MLLATTEKVVVSRKDIEEGSIVYGMIGLHFRSEISRSYEPNRVGLLKGKPGLIHNPTATPDLCHAFATNCSKATHEQGSVARYHLPSVSD